MIILFPGSPYLPGTTSVSSIGAATPAGSLAQIVAWLLHAIGVLRVQGPSTR